jgi:nucleoside-diphosphate-sugar epimerase/predicted dehydrogenase
MGSRIDGNTIPTVKQPTILILGGGAVVREAYLPAFRLLGQAASVKVAEQSEEAVSELRRRFPEMEVVKADFRDALASESVVRGFSAVIVALPNWLHEEAVSAALARGFHVLAEKPLARSREACLRLADEAKNAGCVLAVNMTHRLRPSVRALHCTYRFGLVGEIQSVDMEYGGVYAWPSDSGAFFTKEGGGILQNLGVHYLDFAERLLGEMAPIHYEDDARGGVEANFLFRLRSKGKGIPVCLEMSFSRILRNTLLIKGTRGELVLKIGDFRTCVWVSPDGPLYSDIHPIPLFPGGDWPPSIEGCFAEQVSHFIGAFQNGREPYTTAAQAASVIGLIEWAYQERVKKPFVAAGMPAGGRGGFTPAPAVVTGGTGFVGSHMVERLSEMGCWPITVPVRGYTTCVEVSRFPVRLSRISLLDDKAVRSAVQGARWVFHCAFGAFGSDTALMTTQGTSNVVEAAIAEGCESVVVLSSTVVFGYPNGARVDESWPYSPGKNPYASRKAQMERWCLRRANTSGKTRVVVLNPVCIYGPRGGVYTKAPLLWAQEGTFCWLEGGRGKANVVYVGNLIDAMLAAAATPAAAGERFIISDGVLTWRDFLTPILGPWADRLPSYTKTGLRALHRRRPRPGVQDVLCAIAADPKVVRMLKEAPVTAWAIHAAEVLAPRLVEQVRCSRREPAQTAKKQTKEQLPPLWLADLFGPTATVYDPGKARRVLGWQSRVSLEEGQRAAVTWLRYMKFLEDGTA